jgi:hypothetical protein
MGTPSGRARVEPHLHAQGLEAGAAVGLQVAVEGDRQVLPGPETAEKGG